MQDSSVNHIKELEGTSRGHLVQDPCNEQRHAEIRLSRAWSSLTLKVSREGTTTFQGKLTTLTVKIRNEAKCYDRINPLFIFQMCNYLPSLICKQGFVTPSMNSVPATSSLSLSEALHKNILSQNRFIPMYSYNCMCFTGESHFNNCSSLKCGNYTPVKTSDRLYFNAYIICLTKKFLF